MEKKVIEVTYKYCNAETNNKILSTRLFVPKHLEWKRDELVIGSESPNDIELHWFWGKEITAVIYC